MPRDRKATATHKDMYARKRVAIPEGYYSGDKPNPNLRAFVEAEIHALRPAERRLQHPGLQPADRDDQGDGDLQHARLLVEEAAPGHPAVHPPLHEAGRHRARPILRLGRNGACRPCWTVGKPSPSIAARPRRSSPRIIARPLTRTNFARRFRGSGKRSRRRSTGSTRRVAIAAAARP